MTICALVILTATLTATPEQAPPPATQPTAAVDAEMAESLQTYVTSLLAEAGDAAVLKGKDGWLFFVPELRHIAAGEFWGERAAEVSTASKAEWADPLPQVLDFNEQVRKAGATLIFVPVPTKATIYPDKLPGDAFDGPPTARLDAAESAFIEKLKAEGVEVLDLAPVFLEARKASQDADDQRLYCKTDTHWSPLAAAMTAKLLHERIAAIGGLPEAERLDYSTDEQTLEIDGDLRQIIGDASVPKETLSLTKVGGAEAESRESPVLMVGDSHLLVFHVGGDMHATGAGVADHLARNIGQPIDVVGVRGSGASPSRIALLRRRDNLAGKRVVIYLLTAREYTQTQGWRPVPVVRDP